MCVRRSRKPLEAKLRDALVKKCGPATQEVNFVRNEAKPPVGRADDLAPSRHERVPPQRLVLMFNWCAVLSSAAYMDHTELALTVTGPFAVAIAALSPRSP